MKNKISKRVTYWMGVIAVGLLVGLGVQFAVAFVDTSSTPPANDAPAPMNLTTNQTKTGSLTIAGTGILSTTNGVILNTGGGANGLIVQKGNVGIGTTTPGTKLEVAGQIKITGGSPSAGKVLTSDANGLASWENSLGGPTTGSENLRMIRGKVLENGTIYSGTGFTVKHTDKSGIYEINYTAFFSRPIIVATPDTAGVKFVSGTADTTSAIVSINGIGGAARDENFNFIVVGPK